MNLKVTDNCGATGTATATVSVPNNGIATDDGPSAGYTVTSNLWTVALGTVL